MKFVNEIFNVKFLSAIASVLHSSMKFVHSFARRQHLFDIAAKPTDVGSIFFSHPAPLFMFQFRLQFNDLICL